jgi:hypothetical protein
MVPTFGFFEFEPANKTSIQAEDSERAAYLSEVALNSTQFGSGKKREFDAFTAASLSLLNFS